MEFEDAPEREKSEKTEALFLKCDKKSKMRGRIYKEKIRRENRGGAIVVRYDDASRMQGHM